MSCSYKLRLSIQSDSSFSDGLPFRSLLGRQETESGHRAWRTSSVLPVPLPPEVQKGTIVLPEKSDAPFVFGEFAGRVAVVVACRAENRPER